MTRKTTGLLAAFILPIATVVVLVARLNDTRSTGGPEKFGTATLRVDGDESTVFDWSRDNCDAEHIPDTPTRALAASDQQLRVYISSPRARALVGPSVTEVAPTCDVVFASSEDASATSFDNLEWISSLWSENGHDVVALVHNEYHGPPESACARERRRECWFNSLTIATSGDGGRTFEQPPAPGHVLARPDPVFRAGGGPAGWRHPSNMVRGPDGGVYALVEHLASPTDRRVCLMRSETPARPSSWKGWGGTSFDIAPPRADAASGRCSAIDPAAIGQMTESLTFNVEAGLYLLIGASTTRAANETVGGVYYSWSRDLIDWTPRQLLFRAELLWTYECGDEAPIAYPSVLDPSSTSPTFSTSGRDFDVWFTRFHVPGCEVTSDRDLVKVPVRLVTTP